MAILSLLSSFFLTLSGRVIQFGCTLCNKIIIKKHLKDEKKKTDLVLFHVLFQYNLMAGRLGQDKTLGHVRAHWFAVVMWHVFRKSAGDAASQIVQ